jgi:hypothetical protein
MNAFRRRCRTKDLGMTSLRTLHDDPLEELHEPVALRRRAVVPVVQAVHADDSIHRGIGIRGKFGLTLRVVGRQSSQGGHNRPPGFAANTRAGSRARAAPAASDEPLTECRVARRRRLRELNEQFQRSSVIIPRHGDRLHIVTERPPAGGQHGSCCAYHDVEECKCNPRA